MLKNKECSICGKQKEGEANHFEMEFSQNLAELNDISFDTCDSCAKLIVEAIDEVNLFVRLVERDVS